MLVSIDKLCSVQEYDEREVHIIHLTTVFPGLSGENESHIVLLQEVIQNFDRNMQDLVSTFIENLQGYLAQARDIENVHNEKMMEIAQVTLDKVAKNEIDDEISEELRMVSEDGMGYWHMCLTVWKIMCINNSKFVLIY